jgi:hypothetical protein
MPSKPRVAIFQIQRVPEIHGYINDFEVLGWTDIFPKSENPSR